MENRSGAAQPGRTPSDLLPLRKMHGSVNPYAQTHSHKRRRRSDNDKTPPVTSYLREEACHTDLTIVRCHKHQTPMLGKGKSTSVPSCV